VDRIGDQFLGHSEESASWGTFVATVTGVWVRGGERNVCKHSTFGILLVSLVAVFILKRSNHRSISRFGCAKDFPYRLPVGSLQERNPTLSLVATLGAEIGVAEAVFFLYRTLTALGCPPFPAVFAACCFNIGVPPLLRPSGDANLPSVSVQHVHQLLTYPNHFFFNVVLGAVIG
jgi:hypothetical protein